MDEKAGRIDLEKFALHVNRLAVGAHAVAAPLAARADVHGRLGDMIEAVLSPPLRQLRWIADGLEDARGRSRNKNFCENCILIGSDGGGCHEDLLEIISLQTS
jgi:hypothetical protein